MTDEQREALAYAKGYEAALTERTVLLAAVKDSLKLLKLNAAHIERLEAVIKNCERLEALQGQENQTGR